MIFDLKKIENKLWRWLSRLTVRADNRVLFFQCKQKLSFCLLLCRVDVLFVVCRVWCTKSQSGVRLGSERADKKGDVTNCVCS